MITRTRQREHEFLLADGGPLKRSARIQVEAVLLMPEILGLFHQRDGVNMNPWSPKPRGRPNTCADPNRATPPACTFLVRPAVPIPSLYAPRTVTSGAMRLHPFRIVRDKHALKPTVGATGIKTAIFAKHDSHGTRASARRVAGKQLWQCCFFLTAEPKEIVSGPTKMVSAWLVKHPLSSPWTWKANDHSVMTDEWVNTLSQGLSSW